MDAKLRRSTLRLQPDVESRARALAARLRAGALAPARVELAALLGSAPARLAVGEPDVGLAELRPWLAAVDGFPGAWPWASLGAARLVVPVFSPEASALLDALARALQAGEEPAAQSASYRLTFLRPQLAFRDARDRRGLERVLLGAGRVALGFYGPYAGFYASLDAATAVIRAWTETRPAEAWTARAAWEQAHLKGAFTDGSARAWVEAAAREAVVDWLLDPERPARRGEAVAVAAASPRPPWLCLRSLA